MSAVTVAGFEARELPTSRGTVHAMVGGSGPPLLLLHGYPQSHLMWHAVAPLLAERHTVVAADLAGYGSSLRPAPAAYHAPHSKRALALDQVEAMAALGFDRFAVAGHDRGGRVAYRMALDHRDRVQRLALLDIVPTGEVWRRADRDFARGYWHWAFLALPAPLPERLIAGDTQAFFDLHVRAVEHDDADRDAGHQIACPLLVLWAARGALPRFYGDVLEVWRAWAPDVRGEALDASHFLAEDRPEDTAAKLLDFMKEP